MQTGVQQFDSVHSRVNQGDSVQSRVQQFDSVHSRVNYCASRIQQNAGVQCTVNSTLV